MKGKLWLMLVALTVPLIFIEADLHAFTIYQDISIASSPNPVGSGARAVGMGGAFIAVADDATAASWNPAGLVQLERPELSIVGDYVSSTARVNINPIQGLVCLRTLSTGVALNVVIIRCCVYANPRIRSVRKLTI